MKKKITSSALAALMVAGTTSFSAFAAMSSGTVVIGAKAFDIAYANDVKNAEEIGNAIVAMTPGQAVYVKDFDGNWVENTTGKTVEASVIPAVVYKDAAGKVTEFAAKDMDASATVSVASVSAIANNKVVVTLKEAVTAVNGASFKIVEKGTTTAVEVKSVTLESSKTVVLETAALVAGKAYTLNDVDFTGIAKTTSVPTIKSVTGVDTNTFTMKFNQKMDYSSATNIANYTFSGSVKVVKAELDSTRTIVTLTTDAAKVNVAYSITVDKVMNTDGVSIAKTTRTAIAVQDKIAPRLTTLQVQNNEMLVVSFSDATGMNKTALETITNYSVNDITILSATAVYNETLEQYDKVVLKTSKQEANKAYTLTIENLVDDSVVANQLGKQTRPFRGAAVDITSPIVDVTRPITSYNNTEVRVYFTDNNSLDKATVENIENYVIVDRLNNQLPVLSATLSYDSYPEGYDNTQKYVTLKTAPQDLQQIYSIQVLGITDEFDNALKPISGTTYAKYNFGPSIVDSVAPYVKLVKNTSNTTVQLEFNETVIKANAINPTNYYLGASLGYAIKATLGTDGKTVTLTTLPMSNNTSYTVKFNNIEDRAGNVAYDKTATFVATSVDLDIAAPKILYMYAVNKDEIYVNFDESVANQPAQITVKDYNATSAVWGSGSSLTFNYAGKVDGGQTLIYKANTPSVGATQNDSLVALNYKLEKTIKGAGSEFTDEAGNGADITTTVAPTLSSRYTFSGLTSTAINAQVNYVEQTGPKTVKVYFTDYVKKVAVPAGFTSVAMDTTNGDENLSKEWTLTSGLNLVAGTQYTIARTDFAGATGSDIVANTFYSYYSDSVAPTILGVEAVNKTKVAISYNEAIQTSGTYRIYYYNASNQKVDIYNGPASSKSTDKTILYITGLTLDGSKTYFVEPSTGSLDLADNRESVAGVVLSFVGSDQEVAAYVSGVSIVNANSITVKSAGGNITNVASVERYDSVAQTYTSLTITPDEADYSTTAVDVAVKQPLLAGVTYRVNTNLGSYSFVGNTPNYGIQLDDTDKAVGTARLYWGAFDSSVYKAEVINAATGATLPAAQVNQTQLSGINDVIYVTGLTTGTDYYVVLKNSIGSIAYSSLFTYTDNALVVPEIVAPTFTAVGKSVDKGNDTIVLTFSESIDPSTLAVADVTVAGLTLGNAAIALSNGNTVATITLDELGDNEALTTSPVAVTLTATVADFAGNFVGVTPVNAAFVKETVAPTAVPFATDATSFKVVSATSITVKFNEVLDAVLFVAANPNGFAVAGGTATLTKAELGLDGVTVTLTGTDFVAGTTTVAYTAPGTAADLIDLAGNKIATFSATATH